MTELETVVLGILSLRGPMTAYAVRRELGASPGAIYPLLRRMEQEGWIRARTQSWGERGKSEYAIQPRGMEALRRGKEAIEAMVAELEARRKWLMQIARGIDAEPRDKRAPKKKRPTF